MHVPAMVSAALIQLAKNTTWYSIVVSLQYHEYYYYNC